MLFIKTNNDFDYNYCINNNYNQFLLTYYIKYYNVMAYTCIIGTYWYNVYKYIYI